MELNDKLFHKFIETNHSCESLAVTHCILRNPRVLHLTKLKDLNLSCNPVLKRLVVNEKQLTESEKEELREEAERMRLAGSKQDELLPFLEASTPAPSNNPMLLHGDELDHVDDDIVDENETVGTNVASSETSGSESASLVGSLDENVPQTVQPTTTASSTSSSINLNNTASEENVNLNLTSNLTTTTVAEMSDEEHSERLKKVQKRPKKGSISFGILGTLLTTFSIETETDPNNNNSNPQTSPHNSSSVTDAIVQEPKTFSSPPKKSQTGTPSIWDTFKAFSPQKSSNSQNKLHAESPAALGSAKSKPKSLSKQRSFEDPLQLDTTSSALSVPVPATPPPSPLQHTSSTPSLFNIGKQIPLSPTHLPPAESLTADATSAGSSLENEKDKLEKVKNELELLLRKRILMKPHICGIETLNLSFTAITDECVIEIVKYCPLISKFSLESCPELRNLQLVSSSLKDLDVGFCCNLKSLNLRTPKLEALKACYTSIEDSFFDENSIVFQKLKVLVLSGCNNFKNPEILKEEILKTCNNFNYDEISQENEIEDEEEKEKEKEKEDDKHCELVLEILDFSACEKIESLKIQVGESLKTVDLRLTIGILHEKSSIVEEIQKENPKAQILL